MAKMRIVCFLRRDGIEVYPDHLQEPVYFAFQPEVVKNLEVLNNDMLETQFLVVVEQLKVKKADFLFLIADDALFTKEAELKTAEEMEAELNAFLELVPIATEMRVIGKTAKDKGVVHFALNKALYMRIVSALQRLRYSVLAVVPTCVLAVDVQLGAFGKTPSLDFASIDKIWNQALQAKSENLLLQEPKVAQTPPSVAGVSFSMQVNDKKKLVLSVFFVLLCLVIFGSVMYVTLKPIFVKPKPAISVASTEPAVTPVVAEVPVEQPPVELTSPTPTSEVRKSVKISIINASGVPGQAKQVQELLAPIGYLNFTPANGQPAPNQTTTQVQFKSTVPPEIQIEVETAVKSLFPSTKMATPSAESAFDIVITTLN